jgi:uncharacterized protein with von Willebrand factor type A (vWA) domain
VATADAFPRATASEPLRRFLQAARGMGLRVSAAEGIDAARAVDLVGFGDRALLKDSLGLVLAKTPDEKALYHEAFELYFRRDSLLDAPPPTSPASASQPEDGGDPDQPDADEGSADNAASPTRNAHAASGAPRDGAADGDETPNGTEPQLAQMLEQADRAALATAIEARSRELGIDRIRLLTQRNLCTRRILERMGLRELEQMLERWRNSDSPAEQARARMLSERLEQLRGAVRDHVERSLLLFARGENQQLREQLLRSARLANIDPGDHERMRALVRRLAQRIATRFAVKRRRRQRGQLDVARTLRRNMGWGGVPFLTIWKQKKIEKPRVMVLCDVSGSVGWVAEFLLMFIYALTEVLSDIRAFAYTDRLVEVSEVLESRPIEAAIDEVLNTIGFGTSNYGRALSDFEQGWMQHVGSKTTVLILGDARGNGNDPRTDILDRVAQRAKRIVWLNPEPRSAWGTGDSDMYRYAPYCQHALVCSSLDHIERVLMDLLERGR